MRAVRCRFQLLHEVEQCESKMRVLDIITMVADRMKPHMAAYSAVLAQYLPSLWDTAGGSSGAYSVGVPWVSCAGRVG